MEAKYLLNDIERNKQIKISLRDIENIQDFKVCKDVPSVESLLLLANGHSPIRNYSFNIDKFKNWCGENNLLYSIDYCERMVYLRSN